MLITTHVASGALVGHLVRRPRAALAWGVASHAALDALPHWGSGPADTRHGMDAQMLRVAVADGLTGLALIGVLARATPRGRRGAVLAGIVGACLPDLDKPGRLFLNRSPYPAVVDRLHAAIQRERPELLGRDAGVALTAAAGAVWVLRRSAR